MVREGACSMSTQPLHLVRSFLQSHKYWILYIWPESFSHSDFVGLAFLAMYGSKGVVAAGYKAAVRVACNWNIWSKYREYTCSLCVNIWDGADNFQKKSDKLACKSYVWHYFTLLGSWEDILYTGGKDRRPCFKVLTSHHSLLLMELWDNGNT